MITSYLQALEAGKRKKKIREILRRLEISYNTFNRMCNIRTYEKRTIPEYKLEIIAEHLGVSPDQLLTENHKLEQ